MLSADTDCITYLCTVLFDDDDDDEMSAVAVKMLSTCAFSRFYC